MSQDTQSGPDTIFFEHECGRRIGAPLMDADDVPSVNTGANVENIRDKTTPALTDILEVQQSGPTDQESPPDATPKTPDQRRYDRILAQSSLLTFIPSAEFTKDDVDRTIRAPMPDWKTPMKKRQKSEDTDPYIRELFSQRVLTEEQERHMFRQYNYLKYQASILLATINPETPDPSTLGEIESLFGEATNVRNKIIECNLRLVVYTVKKLVTPSNTLHNLISDGNAGMMQAVERFDYSRGGKFSTYATWAIKTNVRNQYKRNNRISTHEGPNGGNTNADFGAVVDHRGNEHHAVAWNTLVTKVITDAMSALQPREQEIMTQRFGLDGSEPSTLQEIADTLGITKEGVRLIEARALERLNRVLRSSPQGVDIATAIALLPRAQRGKHRSVKHRPQSHIEQPKNY